MLLSVSLEMDNAAFEDDGSEVERILINLAHRVHGHVQHGYAPCEFETKLYDVNGNNVGKAFIVE